MGDPAEKRATYADLLAVPAHRVAELLNGVLITHPRPAPRHALASSVLGSELGGPFHRGKGGPGGWILLDEPELHLLDDVLVPDVAGWRRDRMPELPDGEAFRREGPHWSLLGTWRDDATVGVEPFHEFELELASLWGP